jgi:hypothetical protein
MDQTAVAASRDIDLDAGVVAQCVAHLRAEQHLARFRALIEFDRGSERASDRIDRPALAGHNLVCQHGAGVYSDVHRKSGVGRCAAERDRLGDLERRLCRAARVLLARTGMTELQQHAIAHRRGDLSAVLRTRCAPRRLSCRIWTISKFRATEAAARS